MNPVALVVGGVVVAALATASGRAAVTVSRTELARWVSRRLRGSEAAASLLLRPREVMMAASVTTTAGVIVAGMGVAALMGGADLGTTAALTLIVAIPGLLLVVHALPRAAAQRWPRAFFRRLGPLMRWVFRLLKPLLPPISVEPRGDLLQVLEDRADDDGGTDLRVVRGIMQFAEREVRHVMTPRTSLVAVEEGAPVTEVSRVMAESGFTRLPVYRDTMDNIIGMLHAFDLLKLAPGDPLPVREIVHVVAKESLRGLMVRMQRDRRHMAIVLDEFGGTAGVVTLDDLLAELVAELYGDQSGAPTPEDRDTSRRPALELSGAAGIEDVETHFGVHLPGERRAETIGGYLASVQGRIPAQGDRFAVGPLEFDVVDASPQKLDRVVIRWAPSHVVAIDGAGPRS